MTEQTYRYYFINRPPGLFTMPTEGLVDKEAYPTMQPAPGLLRTAWGWATYDHPLTANDIYKWELEPADLTHRVIYHLMQRIENGWQEVLADYWVCGTEFLAEHAGHDHMAHLVLSLKTQSSWEKVIEAIAILGEVA